MPYTCINPAQLHSSDSTSLERNYDVRSAAGTYEHSFLEFSVGSFGDCCGWCFSCFWRVSVWISSVSDFRFLTLFRTLTVGFGFALYIDSRFLTSFCFWLDFWLDLDSRFWPFSDFDSRLRIRICCELDTEETSFPKMRVIDVLSVCVSMRYGHNRLLTVYKCWMF